MPFRAHKQRVRRNQIRREQREWGLKSAAYFDEPTIRLKVERGTFSAYGSQTIADDAAVLFDIGETDGATVIVAANSSSAPSGMLWVRTTATTACTKIIMSNDGAAEVNTGVLAGTTGSDAHVTFSAHTTGLYIENRRGSALVYSIIVIYS